MPNNKNNASNTSKTSIFSRIGGGAGGSSGKQANPAGRSVVIGQQPQPKQQQGRIVTTRTALAPAKPKSLSERFGQIQEERKSQATASSAANRFKGVMDRRTGGVGVAKHIVRDVALQQKKKVAAGGKAVATRLGAGPAGKLKVGSRATAKKAVAAVVRGKKPVAAAAKKKQQQHQKKKPLTKDKLDADLESYMMKNAKTAAVKLDEDLDSYMLATAVPGDADVEMAM